MAVIVKYVVVRDGKEDLIFTTKKEADAHDKMLDIAEQLNDFFQTSKIDLPADRLDDLTFFMAQNRDQIGSMLKSSVPESTKKALVSSDKTKMSAAVTPEVKEAVVTLDKAPEAPRESTGTQSKVAA